MKVLPRPTLGTEALTPNPDVLSDHKWSPQTATLAI
jgi:hypothetical protein